MRWSIPLFALLAWSVNHAIAQSVESSAFNLLLNGLLSHSVREVSVDEITKDPAVIYVDAREKREYEVSCIQNAIWVGYNDFDINRLSTIGTESKIVVYCSVGYRSEKIAEKLKDAGYKDVSNLYGGIFEWKNQSHPVYNSKGKTERVHAYDKTWGVWLNKGEKIYD